METYWDERFRREGRVWGDAPSRTALWARDRFIEDGVRTVLVPGAGYGRNARVFAEAGLRVVGVEISGEAVALAPCGEPHVHYYRASVLDPPITSQVYDAIYCFNVLHLFRAAERVLFLDRCLDQLAAGGLAFFTAFSEREPSFGKGSRVEQNTFESRPGRPVHYFTESDLVGHFGLWQVVEQGLTDDPEDHGEEGAHIHRLRYILVRKPFVQPTGN